MPDGYKKYLKEIDDRHKNKDHYSIKTKKSILLSKTLWISLTSASLIYLNNYLVHPFIDDIVDRFTPAIMLMAIYITIRSIIRPRQGGIVPSENPTPDVDSSVRIPYNNKYVDDQGNVFTVKDYRQIKDEYINARLGGRKGKGLGSKK